MYKLRQSADKKREQELLLIIFWWGPGSGYNCNSWFWGPLLQVGQLDHSLTFSGRGALHHQHQHRAEGRSPPRQHPVQHPPPSPLSRPRSGVLDPCRCWEQRAGVFFEMKPSDPGQERVFRSHRSPVNPEWRASNGAELQKGIRPRCACCGQSGLFSPWAAKVWGGKQKDCRVPYRVCLWSLLRPHGEGALHLCVKTSTLSPETTSAAFNIKESSVQLPHFKVKHLLGLHYKLRVPQTQKLFILLSYI